MRYALVSIAILIVAGVVATFIMPGFLTGLATLSSDEQEGLIGFCFDGRPHVELAEMLGITGRAVEGRLYRARLALRRKLSHLEM